MPPVPALLRLWPFRRRPLGDIAQAVVDLMEDETQWRTGLLAVHHLHAELTVRNTGIFVSVSAGVAGLRFEGRDRAAVDRAYRRLKRRLTAHAKRQSEQRMREALALPDPPAAAPVAAALPPPGEAASREDVALLEERVRRLREALAREA